MSLFDPYFYILTEDNENFHVYHNCDGALNFGTEHVVDAETKRIIDRAIEEGKRQNAAEIRKALRITQ